MVRNGKFFSTEDEFIDLRKVMYSAHMKFGRQRNSKIVKFYFAFPKFGSEAVCELNLCLIAE